MQFKEITQGYTFIQEEGETIKAFDTVGDYSGLQPVFISQVKANTVDALTPFDIYTKLKLFSR